MAKFVRETEDTITGSLSRGEAAAILALLWHQSGGGPASDLLYGLTEELEKVAGLNSDGNHARSKAVEFEPSCVDTQKYAIVTTNIKIDDLEDVPYEEFEE